MGGKPMSLLIHPEVVAVRPPDHMLCFSGVLETRWDASFD